MANPTRACAPSAFALLIVTVVQAGPPRYEMRLLPSPHGCEAYTQWNGLARSGEAVAILTCEDGAASKAVAWGGPALVELPTLGGPSARRREVAVLTPADGVELVGRAHWHVGRKTPA